MDYTNAYLVVLAIVVLGIAAICILVVKLIKQLKSIVNKRRWD